MSHTRRKVITLLGGALGAAGSVKAWGQQLPVVGFLRTTSFDEASPFIAAFRQGLQEIGYIERQNVLIDFRSALDRYEQLASIAADLIGKPVAVLVTDTRATVVAKGATTTVPIVFATGGDPVKEGFVTSLNRPGGNVTGVTFLASELRAKSLEILRELVPGSNTIGVLVDTDNPASVAGLAAAQEAAQALRLNLIVQHAVNDSDLEPAFLSITEHRIDALVAVGGAFFLSRRRQLAALSARASIPTIYTSPEYVAAGGLMSYGSSVADGYRQAGNLAGKVLKGSVPSDLPVQQATKVELVINLRTARALGLTVPPTLLARADDVIE